jgi:hypothetical protein
VVVFMLFSVFVVAEVYLWDRMLLVSVSLHIMIIVVLMVLLMMIL